MFCPQCDSEYLPGIDVCMDCGQPLVDRLDAGPSAARPAAPEPMVVFATGRADVLAVAKSILMSADVGFGTRGERLQDLFGWGRFPFGANLFIGPVQILVAADDAEDALALLSGIDALEGADSSADSEGDSSSLWRHARTVGRVAALVVITSWALQLVVPAVWSLLVFVHRKVDHFDHRKVDHPKLGYFRGFVSRPALSRNR